MRNKRRAKRWLNVEGPNEHPVRITIQADGSGILLREKHSKRMCVISASALLEIMRLKAEDEAEAARISKLKQEEALHPVFDFMKKPEHESPQGAVLGPVGTQSSDAPESEPRHQCADCVQGTLPAA